MSADDLRLEDLDYDLPPERIARFPAEPRDRSRLLVIDRGDGSRRHLRFRHLPALLRPGDCLVVNDTRVLAARFFARRASGGQVEGLFLQAEPGGAWRAMLKGSARLDPGERLEFDGGPQRLELLERLDGGAWLVRPDPPAEPAELLARVGTIPLPPYIVRARRGENAPDVTEADAERYQTVYCDPAKAGAVAAPTAGLHFTPELLEELAEAGVGSAKVTLHVGAGTFQPVTAARLGEHAMHAERYELSPAAADAIDAARAAGGRIVAVGTTVVRVLESCADDSGRLRPGSGETSLMIRPGHRWRAVDRLITNFHLPRSTLLALVFAFAGRDLTLASYREAVQRGYRFYSYGDAMLIV